MRTLAAVFLVVTAVWAGGADQARSLLDKGKAKEAADAARRIAAKDAKNVDAWLVLADATMALNEPTDGWTALEGAIEQNPESAALREKLGDVFLAVAASEVARGGDGMTIRNYYGDAERMYDEALAIDKKRAGAWYGKAYARVQLSENDVAKTYVSEAIGIDPKLGKAHALQAFMLYGEKKYPEATTVYETALSLDTSDPDPFVKYGHCLFAQGKFDEAKAAYINGLKHHPEADVFIRSGLYHATGRDWKKMAPVLEQATQTAPKSHPSWYYLGFVYGLNGEHAKAISSFRKALDLKPDNSVYAYQLGLSHERAGDGQRALKYYTKALETNPNNADAAGGFERIIRMQSDFQSTEKLYEKLMELAPANGWAQNNYGLILRNWSEQRGAAKSAELPAEVKRRLKRSSEVYEMAAKALPEDPQIQSDTGLLFEFYPAIRDDEKAKEYFTRSLEFSGYTYRDAFSGLNRLCRRTGDWETLKDYAEGVLGALEDQDKIPVAPVGGGAPTEVPGDKPRMIAWAKAAIRDADAKMGE